MNENLRSLPSYVHCENSVIFCIIIPVEPVETILATLHFRWKTPKKSVKFICLLRSGEVAAPQGVVEGFLGNPLGPLPTGLLKPSKVLVMNSGDRGIEVLRKIGVFGRRSSHTHRMIRSFGKESPYNLWKYGTGRATTCCGSTNDCA